jgi:GGDEF domain-containing protein
MLNSVRPGDTVARLGGDEFAVLIEDGGLPGVRAANIEAAVHRPFRVDALTSREVRASTGVYSVKRAAKARADAGQPDGMPILG